MNATSIVADVDDCKSILHSVTELWVQYDGWPYNSRIKHGRRKRGNGDASPQSRNQGDVSPEMRIFQKLFLLKHNINLHFPSF